MMIDDDVCVDDVCVCVDIACAFYTYSWYAPCVIEGDQPYWGGAPLTERNRHIYNSAKFYRKCLKHSSKELLMNLNFMKLILIFFEAAAGRANAPQFPSMDSVLFVAPAGSRAIPLHQHGPYNDNLCLASQYSHRSDIHDSVYIILST